MLPDPDAAEHAPAGSAGGPAVALNAPAEPSPAATPWRGGDAMFVLGLGVQDCTGSACGSAGLGTSPFLGQSFEL